LGLPTNFKVEILLPDSRLEEIAPGDRFSGLAMEIEFPCLDGRVGILPGHAPMLAGVDIGELIIVEDADGESRELCFAIGGGMLEVVEGGDVAIYASSIEYAGSIDIARSEESVARAESWIAGKGKDADLRRARIALRRAQSRIEIARRHGGR